MMHLGKAGYLDACKKIMGVAREIADGVRYSHFRIHTCAHTCAHIRTHGCLQEEDGSVSGIRHIYIRSDTHIYLT